MRSNRLLYATIGVLIATANPIWPVAARAAEDASTMDNAALASSYDAEAQAAKAKADEHRSMMNRYKNLPLPKGSAVTKQGMVEHCQKLVKAYTQASTEAASLAKAHRSMAGQAGH
ncbi:MAG TPA: hypothetical protein VFD92_19930 [Candidatus Binatia bacterium]|nr:hypothetical protein [Candidatus Binatia bacterium]